MGRRTVFIYLTAIVEIDIVGLASGGNNNLCHKGMSEDSIA
jgi:hypothetical protein